MRRALFYCHNTKQALDDLEAVSGLSEGRSAMLGVEEGFTDGGDVRDRPGWRRRVLTGTGITRRTWGDT